MSANIVAIFNDVGLTVTIEIITVDDNVLVLGPVAMTEMSEGAYRYVFATYDESLEYLFVCKDQFGSKVFAINDSAGDQTRSSLENNARIVDNGDGTKTVTIYTEAGAPNIEKQYTIATSGSIETKVKI